MRRFGLFAAALAAAGCQKLLPPAVWVDVDRLTPVAEPAKTASNPPAAPAGLAARATTLPARPAQRLVAEAGIDGEVLAREVDAAQEAALKRLRVRLSAVYRREADRFARAQLRALGDPYRTAFETLYPAYRKAFESYGARRAQPAARLAFLVGVPDPNPQDEPPDPNLTPIGRKFALEASQSRKELKALDREFDDIVLNLLSNVQEIAQDARAATVAAIEANRDALNRQALQEAANTSSRGESGIRLQLARAGVARVPAIAAKSVQIPSTSALPAPPRVESPKALVDARARLEGEVRIWAAQRGVRIDRSGRDATTEFLQWKLQRAGLSPKSPPLSAAR